MSLLLMPLAATLMQVGPAPSAPSSPSVIPSELDELRERQRAEQRSDVADARAGSTRQLIAQCHEQATTDGVAAETDAQSWLAVARGLERATAYHCLGLAFANQSRWSDAAEAFQSGYGLLPETRGLERAQLTALAGNARLAEGETQKALDLLEAAAAEPAPERLRSEIAMDRARALVALERPQEAQTALTEAREIAPDNPVVWLLSATLSRRLDDLAGAQSQIELAASLDLADPAIGLEAGIIAALSGRDEAARTSFDSVIALAPESAQAEAARGYIAQLEAP